MTTDRKLEMVKSIFQFIQKEQSRSISIVDIVEYAYAYYDAGVDDIFQAIKTLESMGKIKILVFEAELKSRISLN